MIDVIGFDADDTLWHNETLYHQAKVELGQILADYCPPQDTKDRLDQTEVNNIKYYGYGIKSFTLSMIETATHVTSGRITTIEIDKIITIAKEMLTAPVDLVVGAESTLETLSRQYPLMLITKGDQFEQGRKIDISGISHFFRYREIVGEKSAQTYLQVLGKYHLDPAHFLMVGNSLRSDILPVLEIGGQAVYIPNETTWFHEHADEVDVNKFDFGELERMSQLPEYLSTLE
jgi:putative hydrolase of the HAD superfamily